MENFQQLEKKLSASKCKAIVLFLFGGFCFCFFVLEVSVSENCLQRELFCHEYGLSTWVLLTFFIFYLNIYIYFLLWCCRCSEWIRIQFLMATCKKKKSGSYLSQLLSEVRAGPSGLLVLHYRLDGSCALNNTCFELMVVGKGYSFIITLI